MKKVIYLILGGVSGFIIGWFSFDGGFIYKYARPISFLFFDLPSSIVFKLIPKSVGEKMPYLMIGLKSPDVMGWLVFGTVSVFTIDILIGIFIGLAVWKILNKNKVVTP